MSNLGEASFDSLDSPRLFKITMGLSLLSIVFSSYSFTMASALIEDSIPSLPKVNSTAKGFSYLAFLFLKSLTASSFDASVIK